MTRTLILPSPLLPRSAYVDLVNALADRQLAAWGGEGAVDIATSPPSPSGPQPVLRAFRAAVASFAPDLVLTHSNGGRYAALAADGIPVVHIDAALPGASGEPTPMAPAGLLDHLADLADGEGMLPPWSRWWPEDAMAEVLPDIGALVALRAGERSMPLGYFRASLGAPAGWQDAPQAYLALSGTYADELARARRLGWPTRVLEGALHLHHLVEPEAVASEVLALAGRLGVG